MSTMQDRPYFVIVMLNSWSKECDLMNTGETQRVTYRRVVKIELTPEQREMIEGRQIGESRGKPVFETIGPSWLEGAGGER